MYDRLHIRHDIGLKLNHFKKLALNIERGLRQYRDRFFDAIASSTHGKRAMYRSFSRDGKLVFSRFSDHDIVVDPGDVVGRSVLQNGSFDRQRTELVAQRARALSDKRVVIEIGANIGTQSIYFLVTGLFDKVICLEPDPINIRMLETNVHLNRLDQKITVLPVGAGDRPGFLTLRRNAGNSGASTLRSEQLSDISDTDILVPVVTIDSLIENGTVDADSIGLVWIDAEGFEEEIFAGCRNLMARKVPMVFEFSTGFYNEQKVARIVDLIFDSYPKVSLVDDSGFKDISRGEMIGQKLQVDIFCSG